MSTVTVTQLDASTFEVTVQDKSSSVHVVTVPAAYAAAIAPGISLEKLVSRSFDFLLERESNTSILRRFDLPVIGRYFPEYEREIRKMLE